jgi:NifU-like protein involved in Fe-S cluster formation
MSDDIYAKELLRWAADASRAGHLPEPKRAATVNNAMCGDKVTMEFAVDPTHEIIDCRHDTKACVLTQASAAIIAANAGGESAYSLARLKTQITAMLKEGREPPTGKWSVYGIFAPVRDHKSRHTCVLLPLEAAEKALSDST